MQRSKNNDELKPIKAIWLPFSNMDKISKLSIMPIKKGLNSVGATPINAARYVLPVPHSPQKYKPLSGFSLTSQCAIPTASRLSDVTS